MRRIDPGTGLTRPRCYGLTLIELLIVLAIAVVVLGIGIPAFGDLATRSRAAGAMLELRTLVETARQAAVTRAQEVTLCGTVEGKTCARLWDGNPTLVFVDANANRSLEPSEELIVVSELTGRARIRWRASGGRNYLRFRANGTVKEYGSFIYCPTDADPRFARQLIINAIGRPRAAVDRDGDGIVESASGAPISCVD